MCRSLPPPSLPPSHPSLQPYYDILPSSLSNMPIFWPEHELAYLQGQTPGKEGGREGGGKEESGAATERL